MLARLGGDEFAVILENLSNREAIVELATRLLAVLLPPFHLSQLALGLVGAGNGGSVRVHWEALVGFAMICLGIALAGHQRDQKANG